MNNLRFFIVPVASLLLASAAPAQVLSYDFNQGTGSATNAGTAGSAGNLTLGTGVLSVPGVSGSPGDLAYDGTNNINSYGATSGSLAGMNNLSTFTITGWINISAWRDSRLFQYQSGFGNGFILSMDLATPGQLTLRDKNFNLMISDSTGGVYDNNPGEWVFFAVSWDGASATVTDAVDFYYGTTSVASSMVSDVNRGSVTNTGTTPTPVVIGNSGAPAPFLTYEYVGYMDNLAVYNTVLDAAAIESIRQAALVPEPSSVMLFGLGAVCALGLIRRQRTPELLGKA